MTEKFVDVQTALPKCNVQVNFKAFHHPVNHGNNNFIFKEDDNY